VTGIRACRAQKKSAKRNVLWLWPPPEEDGPPLCAMPPARGKYTLHGLDCHVVRRCDGVLGCYVRVPAAHELYGRTDLSELSLALDCAEGITYSAGGAGGWIIGSATEFYWPEALTLVEYLARQLAEFTPSDEDAPHVRRVSGIQLRLVEDQSRRRQ
jgi:hypothetical protein